MTKRFNPADYETVDTRLGRFWTDHPDGSVRTRIVSDDGTRVVFQAAVYRNVNDAHPAGVGHAEEHAGQGMVNKTSHTENCETSAVGRALANAGYAPKGQRPTREEMTKVAASPPVRQTTKSAGAAGGGAAQPLTKQQAGALRNAASAAGVDPEATEARIAEMTTDQYQVARQRLLDTTPTDRLDAVKAAFDAHEVEALA